MRFHLDESVDLVVAAALRQRSFDVTTPVETQLRGEPDAKHFEFSVSEGRVLITSDDDFLSIASKDQDHHGIVYGHSMYCSAKEVVRICVKLHEERERSPMNGQVQFVPWDLRRR